jgi:diadenosine tetraphosphate (Ap4A) HIT family hydrolase
MSDRNRESRIDCPFCCHAGRDLLVECDFALAFLDGYPVAEGHTLVIPRRHVASLFDLPEVEQAAIWRIVAEVRRLLVERYQVDGFNIGLNDGKAAGQTVTHAHVHVIPRRRGDVADPRGGVRWVVPDKAAYWGDKR